MKKLNVIAKQTKNDLHLMRNCPKTQNTAIRDGIHLMNLVMIHGSISHIRDKKIQNLAVNNRK